MDYVFPTTGEDEPKTSGEDVPSTEKNTSETLYIARRLETVLEGLDSNTYWTYAFKAFSFFALFINNNSTAIELFEVSFNFQIGLSILSSIIESLFYIECWYFGIRFSESRKTIETLSARARAIYGEVEGDNNSNIRTDERISVNECLEDFDRAMQSEYDVLECMNTASFSLSLLNVTCCFGGAFVNKRWEPHDLACKASCVCDILGLLSSICKFMVHGLCTYTFKDIGNKVIERLRNKAESQGRRHEYLERILLH